MPVVMYCWRIKKGDFWAASRAMKQDAFMNHGAITLACRMREKAIRNEQEQLHLLKAKYDEDLWRMFMVSETGLMALQLFDEGRTWLVRPLYFGYDFQNQVDSLDLPFTPVFYDDRMEGGTWTAKRKADWVIDKVDGGEYFVHIILGADEPFSAVIYGHWPHGIEKTRESGPPKP